LSGPPWRRQRSGRRSSCRLSIHGLRYTYARLALESGVGIKTVSANRGHANISITCDVYAHVLQGMRDAAADTIGGYMFAPVAPSQAA
jgi:integrase